MGRYIIYYNTVYTIILKRIVSEYSLPGPLCVREADPFTHDLNLRDRG